MRASIQFFYCPNFLFRTQKPRNHLHYIPCARYSAAYPRSFALAVLVLAASFSVRLIRLSGFLTTSRPLRLPFPLKTSHWALQPWRGKTQVVYSGARLFSSRWCQIELSVSSNSQRPMWLSWDWFGLRHVLNNCYCVYSWWKTSLYWDLNGTCLEAWMRGRTP